MSKHKKDRSNNASNQKAANPRAIAASPMDIICGRGFHIVNHRGNLDLHLLVNKFREEYQRSQRSHKTKIIKHILGEIKSNGSRFIRKVSDGNGAEMWEEVDDETAYKKVSHALRLRTENESNRGYGCMAVIDDDSSASHRGGGGGQAAAAVVGDSSNDGEEQESDQAAASRRPNNGSAKNATAI